MYRVSQIWHLLAGYFLLPRSLPTVFSSTCFRISSESLPGGSSWGIRGVWVDIPGRAASVSVSTLSVAQSFATCSRNSLYLIFYVGFSFDNSKRIEKCTIYKPKCNFLWPLHCFSEERIIRKVLICPINTLHEYIILKNTNRFFLYFFISLWNINHCWIVNCGNHIDNTSIPPGLKKNFTLSPEWGFATFQRLL